jgi:hypothetical protein
MSWRIGRKELEKTPYNFGPRKVCGKRIRVGNGKKRPLNYITLKHKIS